jgi:aminoglycoside 3-N-acetyltransferase
MLNTKDLRAAFQTLHLKDVPVIAHTSLSSLGQVEGGAPAVVEALLDSVGGLMMPTHTYVTMVTPLDGPALNGVNYEDPHEQARNSQALFYEPDLPADGLMGHVAEALRVHPQAKRSGHPILSFAGVNVDDILAAQTVADPLAPIGVLAQKYGWALLLGVDQTRNTSIHYAEQLARRPSFLRWALIKDLSQTKPGVRPLPSPEERGAHERVLSCPGFPGDSRGFEAAGSSLGQHSRRVPVGNALVQAIPLAALIYVVGEAIKQNPIALLCTEKDCERCSDTRKRVLGMRDLGE